MAKIWCEACKGTKFIPVNDGSGCGHVKCTCPDCKGNGFIEADVVEVEKVRKEFENNVLRNPIKCFDVIGFRGYLDSLKEGK